MATEQTEQLVVSAGAWLATYWVHAAVAVLATLVLVRTVLRSVPSEVRAAAWRAALVAPLVTASLRHGGLAAGPRIEVAWLGASDHSIEATQTKAVRGLGEPKSLEPLAGQGVAARGSALPAGGNGAAPAPHDMRPRVAREPRGVPRSADLGTSQAPTAGRGAATSRGVDALRADDGALVGASTDFAATDFAASSGGAPSSAAADGAMAPGVLTHVLDFDLRRVALLAALVGAVLALARWLDGWLRLGRHLGQRRPLPPDEAAEAANMARSMGVPDVRVVESDAVAVPMAFGFLRREVCLPRDFSAGLTRAEWRAALAHEFAHHVRGDGRALPVLRLLARVFGFQPLNLLAWRELQRESELAADELAVAHTGGPEDLAMCIAKVATRVGTRHAQVPAAAMTGAPTMAVRPALVVERAERLVASIGARTARVSRRARLATLVPTAVVASFAPLMAAERGPDGADVRREARSAAFDRTEPRALLSSDGATASSPAVADDEALSEPLAQVAAELGAEFALARAEIDAALATTSGERQTRLLELSQRLTTIEQRAAQLENLVHGLAARAKASSSDTSPELDTQRESTR